MHVRPPTVAGRFYPHSPQQLSSMIESWERPSACRFLPVIRAMVVPHAGYIYSGEVAAGVCQFLKSQADRIHRVILLGPSHHFSFLGCALPSVDWFSTPLGNIEVDREWRAILAQQQDVVVSDDAHAPEHCLEVQLPLLQTYLGAFRILPILTSRISPARMAELLDPVWLDEESLLVVSSDLSHYHSYRQAQRLDQQTCEQIEAYQATLKPEQACGSTAINALLLLAKGRGYQLSRAMLINSGDTEYGNQQRVVGYASYIVSDPE
ncbi:AmmeMemoRadiSam system protein B [Vibrio rotiferianus]|uniref:AmmeMemoRadiSam system protein B n=1 Tax=Vibrio rotiferianus TaxID=190895 RepID=UPI00397EB8B6